MVVKKELALSCAKACLILTMLFSSGVLAQNGGTYLENGSFVSEKVTPWRLNVDLRSLPSAPLWQPGDPIEVVPEGIVSEGPVQQIQGWSDSTQQLSPSTSNGEFLLAFEAHPPGNSSPPDTVGAVGPNHYISMVNASRFAIWDKSGNPLVAPVALHSLWVGGTSPCEDGDGDPIVVYDSLADRWLMQEFDFTDNSFCVYVSMTADPVSGGWYGYAFSAPNFPDYPQYGVWNDAYYVSTFESPQLGIYAFDRNSMLAGEPASYQRFEIPHLFGSSPRVTRILPADIGGTQLPPAANQPNVFLRSVHSTQDSTNPTTRLELYEYDVDWQSPGNSSFSLVQSITPAPFALLPCSPNTRDCIPQPDTSNKIDALFNRAMRQLHYRSFPDGSESMVVNQVVDVGDGVAGIRWWELHRDTLTEGPSAQWSIRQESTYSPDNSYRFMGSVTMNKKGDIALGYSASSETEYPSIRVTARHHIHPLNQMTMQELTLVDGISYLTVNQRWGDYTSIYTDPSDDNVFWYINQILTSPNQRSVWVGAFRIPDEIIFSDSFEDLDLIFMDGFEL